MCKDLCIEWICFRKLAYCPCKVADLARINDRYRETGFHEAESRRVLVSTSRLHDHQIRGPFRDRLEQFRNPGLIVADRQRFASRSNRYVQALLGHVNADIKHTHPLIPNPPTFGIRLCTLACRMRALKGPGIHSSFKSSEGGDQKLGPIFEITRRPICHTFQTYKPGGLQPRQ